jgi:nitrite reductase/ring-hydroxylating ferredoxin subunit
MIENDNTYPQKILDGKVFVNVAKSNEIVEKKGYRFIFYDDLDFQIAIFRINGSLFCINNICPHRHQDKLFEGIINDDLTVTCLYTSGLILYLQAGMSIRNKVSDNLMFIKFLKKTDWFG